MSRHPSRRDRARELRRPLTPTEALLWQKLRNRAIGFKFRRQHPIGPFFADLACSECKLVIEADGESHLIQEDEDARRSEYLEAHGWLVLRFWNTQVFEDLEAIVEEIYHVCEARRPAPSPCPLPLSTGGEGNSSAPARQSR